MDMERLKQWLEMAQKFHGKEFWDGIFDPESGEAFMSGATEGAAEPKSKPEAAPRVDIWHNPREVMVVIDLPGLGKEDVHLSLSGRELWIRGNASRNYPGMALYYAERTNGEFQKRVELPCLVDSRHIKAQFRDGLLEVRCPCEGSDEESIRID